MTYVRTEQHRALRRALIHRWRPWLHSTGPRSTEGKERSARRGYKGGLRPLTRELCRALREQQEALSEALND